MNLARTSIDDLGSRLLCTDCASCRVICPNGFDVPKKVQDIIRLKTVPREFLG